MTRHEQKEVLKYVQGREVVFIDKAKELLETAVAKWESLGDAQMVDIAVYIIPEVGKWCTITLSNSPFLVCWASNKVDQ